MQFTDEQKRAIYTKDCNLLVAAGAGSGKTAVLVERIINKVINDGIDIDKLLVVTFTNSAALEMRERLSERLFSEIDKNPKLYDQIKLLSKASITTIDSFCLRVVKDNFFKLGLDPNFRIAETSECEILKLEALEEMLEEKYESNDEDFINIFNNYASNKGDDNLRDLILKIFNFTRTCLNPDEWINQQVEKYDLKIFGNDFDNYLTNSEYGKLVLNYTKEQISNSINELKTLYNEISDSELALKYLDVINEDINNLNNLLNNCSSFDNAYISINNFEFARANSSRGTPEELKDKINDVRKAVKATINDDIKKKYFVSDSKDVLNEYNNIYINLKTIANLVIDFSRCFMNKKLEKNILDFNDIEHFALLLLTNNEEIANVYKDKFDEIMIDEYQDSNLIQENILNAISNNKMFMVGDVKQSIYRFRQARPDIFLNKYNTYVNASDDNQDEINKKILLFKNFRSNNNIIEQVNHIFKNIMSKDVGEIDYNSDEYLKFGADYYEHNGEKAELCLIETNIDDEEIIDGIDSNANLEAKFIAKKIKEIVNNKDIYDKDLKKYRKVKYRDIVILLRSTVGRIDALLEELSNKDIPVYSENGGDYFNNTEVQTILSLLRIIDNPIQDIPLVGVLRSQIGGFSIDELSSIRLSDRKSSFYEAMIKTLNQENDLSIKVNSFLEKLYRWRELSKDLSLWELISLIYEETGFIYFVSLFPDGYKRKANLKLLLERAERFEKTSFKGLFNFLKYIDNIKASSNDFGESKVIGENEDVVRIMSVHKSKGLEFPIVFLAATDKKFNFRDLSENIILDQELGFGVDVVDYDYRIRFPSISKWAISIKSKKESLSEEMRILYVALTRAREKLYVTGLVKEIDKAISKYSSPITRYKISNSNSMLDWIAYSIVNKISDWKINRIDYNSLIENDEEVTRNDNEYELDVSNAISYDEVDKQMNWKYKYEIATNLPNKVSISEIKRNAISMNEEVYNSTIPDLIKAPEFLNDQIETGAKYGTVLHETLQKLDFEDISKVQIFELLRKITDDDKLKESIYNKILNFSKTELFNDIKNAKKVYKETSFNLNLKAKEIYNVDSDEDIMIQGIIDLYFVDEDGNIVLVDYKTDNVDNEQELIKRYKVQLELYKRALEEILEKQVSKTIIYSFKFNKSILL
ncbi:MAG: helicase-exonuclease AddAB subunit AddA [Clostridia bacterium]|nr:helicase-exonuclease AddAB subunit AddA [Clostridia bacterium]